MQPAEPPEGASRDGPPLLVTHDAHGRMVVVDPEDPASLSRVFDFQPPQVIKTLEDLRRVCVEWAQRGNAVERKCKQELVRRLDEAGL